MKWGPTVKLTPYTTEIYWCCMTMVTVTILGWGGSAFGYMKCGGTLCTLVFGPLEERGYLHLSNGKRLAIVLPANL